MFPDKISGIVESVFSRCGYDQKYGEISPCKLPDLEEIYLTANRKSKTDERYLHACRRATADLHEGNPGYIALWRHILHVSINALRSDYSKLEVHFDTWLGESDAQPYIDDIIETFIKEGYAKESSGALIVDIKEDEDNQPMPPVILRKSDGAALYHTTDIATIVQRVKDHDPTIILYVVDKRQSLHFDQIFRCVRKTHLVKDSLHLEHIPFGTMNGVDGKPFKTRSGGTLKLKDLIDLVTEKALNRLIEGDYAATLSEDEKKSVARCVGIAALKFGDLSNKCARDYVFELDRFLAFEGKTGPYLLYSAVRAKSILNKAGMENGGDIHLIQPKSYEERELLHALLTFPKACRSACDKREPMHLCDYGYTLASAFSSLYAKIPILKEKCQKRKQGLLSLTHCYVRIIETVLTLLGIRTVERM